MRLASDREDLVLGVQRVDAVERVDLDPLGLGRGFFHAVAADGAGVGRGDPVRQRQRHVQVFGHDEIGHLRQRPVRVNVARVPAEARHVDPPLNRQRDIHVLLPANRHGLHERRVLLAPFDRDRVLTGRHGDDERMRGERDVHTGSAHG